MKDYKIRPGRHLDGCLQRKVTLSLRRKTDAAWLWNDEAATLLVHYLGVIMAIGECSLATTFIAALEQARLRPAIFQLN